MVLLEGLHTQLKEKTMEHQRTTGLEIFGIENGWWKVEKEKKEVDIWWPHYVTWPRWIDHKLESGL